MIAPILALSSPSYVITLCGSARFEAWFKVWNIALTMAGHTVFTLTAFPSDFQGQKLWYTEDQKKRMDGAHLRKIARSDMVVVLNPFAYLGDSTLSEVQFARGLEVKVRFLESWGKGNGLTNHHTDKVRAAAAALGVPQNFQSPIDTHLDAYPWDLLGPAGDERSALVTMVKNRLREIHGSED